MNDILKKQIDAQQAPICWLKRHKTQDLKEVFFDKAEADAWVAQFQPGFAWLEELRTFQPAPVQEGKWVGTVVDSGKGYKVIGFSVDGLTNIPIGTRCYTSPQPAQRKPLTDEQVNLFINGRGDEDDDNYVEPTGDGFGLTEADLVRLVRRVEAAHGIKENT